MNLCKVIQAQAKSIKVTWSYARVRGKKVKLLGAKKRSADGEELNTLVLLSVEKAMKMTKDISKKENSYL